MKTNGYVQVVASVVPIWVLFSLFFPSVHLVASSKYGDSDINPAHLSREYKRSGVEQQHGKGTDALYEEPLDYYSLDEMNGRETADEERKRGSSERRRISSSTIYPRHRTLSRMMTLGKSFSSPATASKRLLVGVLTIIAVSMLFALQLGNILRRCLQQGRGASREADGSTPRSLADSGDLSRICALVRVDMPEGPSRTDVGTSQSADLESDQQAENRQTARMIFHFFFPPLLVALVLLGVALFEGDAGAFWVAPAAILAAAAICVRYYQVKAYRRQRSRNGSYQALREETPDASEEPRHEEGNKSGDGNDGKKPGAQKGQKKGTKNASPATRF